MRMTPEHYEFLKAGVKRNFAHYPALIAEYANNPKIKDAQRAARWRLYHAAAVHSRYNYREWAYTDAHIDTAMRRIVAELGAP